MILGHQKQWQFLRKSVELGKVSHAYLFSGEKELGKKLVAREFVKMLNCEKENASLRPCQKCPSCLQIEKTCEPSFRGLYPDLTFVEPAGKEIEISQIRDLCWNLSLKPYSARFKTALIDDAEKMNSESANALLKTLEEPSGQAVLILVSAHPETLPQTIVSRTQVVKFFPLSKKEMADFANNLESKAKLSKKEIGEAVLFSEGKPGKLVKFISDPQKMETEKERLKELQLIAKSDLAFRFQYAKKITEEEENLGEILENWLRYFRGLLRNIMEAEDKNLAGGSYSVFKLQKIIKTLDEANFLISSTNVNPRLALEIAMLEF